MTDPVRWGVLGCAAIAVNKVIPAMLQADNCDIVGIASRDADRAAAAAAQLGLRRSYGSYQELLDDPEIEAVYIPLPNNLHAEWTLRAADAGKHVLCEKPLAMDAAEAAEMVAGCRKAGVKLMEAFMYRLHPSWVRVRELVAEGRIGELKVVDGFFSYNNTDPANIRNIAELGGGGLMDIGCYPINVARMMFGSEPTSVQASVHRDRVFGTDTLTSAVLDFDGRHAKLTCSTQLEHHQRVHLVGTEGWLLVEIPFNIPPDLPTRVVVASGGNPPVAPELEVLEFPPADQYRIQGELFSAAVREDTDVPTPPEDAIANMVVIDEVLAAAGDS
ncbi:Gfo/Idh/MocA family protein [Phytoactinopolyspora halotolerans]|uniref:Gfo/Idh/MocA family oxidoreductase n=1 Tax=Phytoactinopolyspora halotolerans TaxID=1981512 RepID=A0A6L9SHB8_9ACTN|nr:Gfo/Idh/MocA family oxidoreductase [Phytoactinopolyspora halotolerans]NEE03711.1 Gfo/Idh/MocA family oxidoreductase [Phytoactinopolyspora halotolerans]